MTAKSPKSPAQLRVRLTNAVDRFDSILSRLHRVLSNPAGIDATLCTLCYGLVLVHSQLQRLIERRYERLALTLVDKAFTTLSPDDSIVSNIQAPVTRLTQTSAGVKALEEVIGDFRIFVRLWGLLGIWDNLKNTYTRPPPDRLLKWMTWMRICSDVAFQALENGAYLASKGVLRDPRWAKRESKWWLWSNRFWMSGCVFEALRLLRIKQLESDQATPESPNAPRTVDSDLDWRRQFYANAGWIPLTMHWSTEDGFLSDTWIGILGLVPGVIGLTSAWEIAA